MSLLSFKKFSFLFIFMSIIDYISTLRLLENDNNIEGNLFLRDIVKYPIFFLGVKILIIVIIILILKRQYMKNTVITKIGMSLIIMLMSIVLVNNIVLIASAESGTISLSYEPTVTFQDTGSGANIGTTANLIFNSSIVQRPLLLQVQVAGGVSFAYPSNSTHFTILNGGVGEGMFFYNANSRTITYSFYDTSDLILTANKVNLSFDDVSVANQVTYTGAQMGVVSTTHICGLRDTAGASIITPQGNQANYTCIYSTVVDVGYSVVYSPNNLYSVYINKSGNIIATQAGITDYLNTTDYFLQSGLDTVSFNFTGTQTTDGIGIRIHNTVADNHIGINNTNCPNCIEDTNTFPGTGANIYTDKNIYTIGDNIDVEWLIASDPYDNLLSDCEFWINDVLIVSNINQRDNFTILSPRIGVTKLQVLCGIFTNTIAGEKIVNVIGESQSYITIQNNSAKAGSLNNFTYKWGFTPSPYRWLNIYKYDSNKKTWIKESSNSIQAGSQANIVYNTSILIKSDGNYYAEICDNNRVCPVAKILFNSIYSSNTLIQNYSYSNISIISTLSTYAQNDWLEFNTRIDGVNYSSGLSFSVRLYNPATTTIKILQYIHNENEDNKVYLDSAMESGTQKLQLIGTNSSGIYILNETNIIISYLDSEGFALNADKYNICSKDAVIITAISPQNATISVSTLPIKRYNFTGSKTFEIKGSQDYTVSLDVDGLQKKLISINVNQSCIIPIAPSTPSSPQTMNNLMTFISMPAFWGILIFVACVIITAWKASNATGIVALVLANLEAIVGLWSPFTVYVLIVTWIIAAIFFTLGRNTTTGGK